MVSLSSYNYYVPYYVHMPELVQPPRRENGDDNSIYDDNGDGSGNGNGSGNDYGGGYGNERRHESSEPRQFVPSAQALDLAERFYAATYGLGTDDSEFNAVCEQINARNVMDIMQTWNLMHSTEKGESFMEAFMWDADSGQKEKYAKQIATALKQRALAAGVFEECREDFAIIDNNLRNTVEIPNSLSENFDKIIQIIAEAEGTTNGKPYEASSETKGWFGKACDAAGGFFDDAWDFLTGWL